jgi:hypothetical protein
VGLRNGKTIGTQLGFHLITIFCLAFVTKLQNFGLNPVCFFLGTRC